MQVFDSQTLALFTSSLFLAGLFTAPVASIVTRRKGRKLTMLCAGISVLIGSGALMRPAALPAALQIASGCPSATSWCCAFHPFTHPAPTPPLPFPPARST